MKCYECSGYGHFARDCVNRKMRTSVSDVAVKAAKGNARHSHCVCHQPVERSSFGLRFCGYIFVLHGSDCLGDIQAHC